MITNKTTSYSRLSTHQAQHHPSPFTLDSQDQELDEAFDDSEHSDEPKETDHLVLNVGDHQPSPSRGEGTSNLQINTQPLPGSYDFERDPYHLIPNVPTQPTVAHNLPRQRIIGLGNDGVFANLSAKPTSDHPNPLSSPTNDKDEVLPTYDAAALDSSPPYWETTVTLPGGMGAYGILGPDDVLVDGLVVGNLFGFAWNLLVSMSFQFIGFLLTYLLHTTHAAKNGSRAGLGITLIQYGLYTRTRANELNSITPNDLLQTNGTLNGVGAQDWTMGGGGRSDWDGSTIPSSQLDHHNGREITAEQIHMSTVANEWLSYVLIAIGWFLLLGGLVNYWRAVRWARAVRSDDVTGGTMA